MRKGFSEISEFMFIEDEIDHADIIMIPGSSRKELIMKAAELYKQGKARYILISGGRNKKLKKDQTEAEYLRDEAIRIGVPSSSIIVENKASNTYENAKLSYEMCVERNISCNKIILVCKNYHARRAYITYLFVFPSGTEFIIQPVLDGENITKDNWTLDEKKKLKVFNELEKVGKYSCEYMMRN